jgi:hypothetical protein
VGDAVSDHRSMSAPLVDLASGFRLVGDFDVDHAGLARRDTDTRSKRHQAFDNIAERMRPFRLECDDAVPIAHEAVNRS